MNYCRIFHFPPDFFSRLKTPVLNSVFTFIGVEYLRQTELSRSGIGEVKSPSGWVFSTRVSLGFLLLDHCHRNRLSWCSFGMVVMRWWAPRGFVLGHFFLEITRVHGLVSRSHRLLWNVMDWAWVHHDVLDLAGLGVRCNGPQRRLSPDCPGEHEIGRLEDQSAPQMGKKGELPDQCLGILTFRLLKFVK